jgi:hypothetical protein
VRATGKPAMAMVVSVGDFCINISRFHLLRMPRRVRAARRPADTEAMRCGLLGKAWRSAGQIACERQMASKREGACPAFRTTICFPAGTVCVLSNRSGQSPGEAKSPSRRMADGPFKRRRSAH